MKILIAAYYEFLKNLRDIKMVIFIVVTPIIITFILGTAIQKEFNKDSSEKISIGYVNKDSGTVGKGFDEFLKQDEIKKRLKTVDFSDEAGGLKALAEAKIDVLISLTEYLSESLSADDKLTIKLYGNKNLEFVETLVNGFTKSFNTVTSVIASGGIPSHETGFDSSLERIYYTKVAVVPSAIDYYGILILLQILVIGALFGVFITASNPGSDIHIRLHSIPVAKEKLILGRIIGSVAYLFTASIINIICTKLLYGVNWSGNAAIILSTVLVFSIIIVCIGVLIGLLVPGYSTSMMLIILMMMFFGTFSGSITPVSVNSTIGLFIPNYHAKMLLFGTIYGYSKSIMLQSAFWLLGMMTVICGALVFFIRRYRYDNI
jgi:ABC-2 type transport system permease protein